MHLLISAQQAVATAGSYASIPESHWYDLSLVDGFNIPMSIDNTGDDKCFKPDCLADSMYEYSG